MSSPSDRQQGSQQPGDDPTAGPDKTLRDRLRTPGRNEGDSEEVAFDETRNESFRTRENVEGLGDGTDGHGLPDGGHAGRAEGHGSEGHGSEGHGSEGHGSGGHGSEGHSSVIEVAALHVEDIDPRAERRGELLIAAMLAGAGVMALLFTAAYFAIPDSSPYQTPAFGGTMGAMLLLLGAVPIMYVKYLVPSHLIEGVQQRHPPQSEPQETEEFKADFAAGAAATGLGRRTAIKLAGGFAGSVALLPAVVPLLSLGRYQHKERALRTTAFAAAAGKRTIRLVAADTGRYIRPGDMAEGAIYTVQPEGHLTDADSPAILIRMRPGVNQPAPGRKDYAYGDAYVCYSAVCTHAGCPVKLYEQQTHNLLCPCHQSTFLANEGCRPIFGPAARPLPQLPISVDAEGYFVATGDFSDPIGPSYWERDS